MRVGLTSLGFKSKRIRPQFSGPVGHLFDGFCKQVGIRCTDMKHVESFASESDFVQQGFRMRNSFRGPEISVQEMALTG